MTREEIENVSPEIEMLARMWMECDPNRMVGSEPGSGWHPDDPSDLFFDGIAEQHPRWKWFIQRAEASAKYFAANGFQLNKS